MKTLAKYFYDHQETGKTGYAHLMSDSFGKDHVWFDGDTTYSTVANMVRFMYVNDGNTMSFDGFIMTKVEA